MRYRFGKSERERLGEVATYLAGHLHEEVRFESLYRVAAMSQQKLNEGFTRFYGMTVQAYLHLLRMQKARELLLSTEESIASVSEATGYSVQGSFSRAYKRFYGLTPTDERKKATGEGGLPGSSTD